MSYYHLKYTVYLQMYICCSGRVTFAKLYYMYKYVALETINGYSIA